MRMYVEFARKTFHRHAIYRIQYLFGLINSVFAIFISASIWQAVYGTANSIDGISKNEIITYAVLGMIIRTLLSMNEFLVEVKIHTGEIAVDLLKPFRFLNYLFAVVLGEVVFNLWTKVLPLSILAFFVFQLVFPQHWLYILLFLISLLFSYLVLYSLNLIFWLLSFWIHRTWSVITIKNTLVLLLSGATIPLWFLPDAISKVLYWLPFKDIYFTPLNIFLGKVSLDRVGILYLEQIFWIVFLCGFGRILWSLAQRKLVIHGG